MDAAEPARGAAVGAIDGALRRYRWSAKGFLSFFHWSQVW
jgi:hypothetical protein